LIGEDNAEVLGALGLDSAELERLAQAGVVYCGPQRRRAAAED
jgi:hypothetical protein